MRKITISPGALLFSGSLGMVAGLVWLLEIAFFEKVLAFSVCVLLIAGAIWFEYKTQANRIEEETAEPAIGMSV